MLPSGPKRSRRDFIKASTAAALAGAVPLGAAEPEKRRFKCIGFIKPFQKVPYRQIADIVAQIGWDGIECPLRKDGAIEPVRVEDDLPKLVEALRANGLELSVISTDVEDANDPLSQRVLRTASKLGIHRYRLKHYYYDLEKAIPPQLEVFKAKLRDLAQLNRDLNLQGSIQNHSGKRYVGAPVWDIWELIRDLDPKQIGIFFDIGHATIEGGYSWPIHAKLMEPFFSVVSVKDFSWSRFNRPANSTAAWTAKWCPLGDGMVSQEFFRFLEKTNFNGPITQHHEYELGDGAEMIAPMRKDLATLKRWLQA